MKGMILQLLNVIVLILVVGKAGANQYQGSSPYVANYPDPQRDRQQHEQSQPSQQFSVPPGGRPPAEGFFGPRQRMHQSPPPGVHPHNIPPHLYRNSGTFFNGPTQPQGLGLFSRIKNSLSAAGSAITNAFESGAEEESTSQYAARSGQFPPGSLSAYSDRRFSDNGHIPGDRAPHVPPQDRGNFAGYQGPAGREPTTFPPGFGSSPKSSQEPANEGLFGKMRHFLSSDERSQQQSASPPPGGHMYRPPAMTREPQYMPQLPPQHQQQQQQHQYQQLHQHQQPPDFAQPEGANAPPVPQGYPGNVFGAQSTAPQYPPQHPSQAQSQSQPAFPSHPVQETHGAAAFQPAPLSMHQGSPSFPPHGNNAYAPPASAPATPADPYEWLNDVPSEPQVLIHEDSVVFIMKPKEFHRKKFDMAQAGPGALQVFSDFERVFTRFKTPDGNRAFTTEELMEASGVISAEGIADMQRAVDEMERGLLAAAAADSLRVEEVTDRDDFASENEAADDAANGDATYEVYESGARQYHQALATKGNVPLAYVYPAVRARLGTLGLRDQWKDPMQMLLARSVPFYVFSSGLGDIVTCALAAAGLPTPTAADVHGGGGGGAAAAGALPNNVRVISNFFRTAPDGTIRAFTQPTIHDRNKNATTAARLMGMPVPQRPHALVLAAHEDDAARMTDGVQGLQQTLSIGYMEVADDLPQRLPVFLNSFDAVIVGDGSFKFVASVLEDILRTPIPSKAATAHQASGLAGKLPSLGFGLRRGLGMLLNAESSPSAANAAQHVAPSAMAAPAASSAYGHPPSPPAQYAAAYAPQHQQHQQHQHQQQHQQQQMPPQQYAQYPQHQQSPPSHPAVPPAGRPFADQY